MVEREQELVNRDPMRKKKRGDITQGYMNKGIDLARIPPDCYFRNLYK